MPRTTSAGALLHHIQGGDTVRFIQGREVEDVFDEGVDALATDHRHLSDMNQFRGTLSDDLDTQGFLASRVRHNLENTVLVPADMTAGDFLEGTLSDQRVTVSLPRLGLVQADRGARLLSKSVPENLRSGRFSWL